MSEHNTVKVVDELECVSHIDRECLCVRNGYSVVLECRTSVVV
jgi:hypothetical protein